MGSSSPGLCSLYESRVLRGLQKDCTQGAGKQPASHVLIATQEMFIILKIFFFFSLSYIPSCFVLLGWGLHFGVSFLVCLFSLQTGSHCVVQACLELAM